MTIQTYHVIVHGLVQGVYFRQSTRDKAIELGLTGTVKNREDRSVEILVSGDSGRIHELIEWCKTGPPRAKVERLDMHEQPLKKFEGFRIIY